MAIAMFKQAPGQYIIGVNQIDTVSFHSCFLRYTDGRWQDISSQIIANYNLRKYYEVPYKGTTVKVFPLVRDESGMDNLGQKYDRLYWKKGKFDSSP